ncbi:MAG TPA: toprim domain-containing protein, partial [Ktedonobacterales bacterium]|nr:toprim domain-containing protein [Ktedonobacterales bacterium]
STLYGFDLARDAIKRNDRVVIVEGYMDAIVTHQYGTRNVVACIGSAITEKHIRQIKKLTRRVTLALDPDAAGESAAARGIVVAQQAFDRVAVPIPIPTSQAHRPGMAGFASKPGGQARKSAPQGMVRFEEQVDAEITVARLPAHEDPDEFVRRDAEGWRRAINEAQPLIDFLIETQTAGLSLDTPQGKLEARRRLLPVIAQVRDRTLADEYVGRLAQKLRLDKVDLRRDLSATRQRLDREAQTRPPVSVREQAGHATHGVNTSSVENADGVGGKSHPALPDRSELGGDSSGAIEGTTTNVHGRATLAEQLAHTAEQTLEMYCIGLALDFPVVWSDLQAILEPTDFTDAGTRALFVALAETMNAPLSEQADETDAAQYTDTSFDVTSFLAGLHPTLAEAAQRAQALAIAEDDGVPDGADPTRIARDAAYRLKRLRLKAQMAELDALQRDAEQSHDAEAVRALLIQKQRLLAQRRAIDSASALFG